MSDPRNSDRDAIDSIEPSLASSALDRTFGAHFGTSTQILPDDLATREAMRQAARGLAQDRAAALLADAVEGLR